MWPFDYNRKKLEEIRQFCFLINSSQTVAADTRFLLYRNLIKRLNEIEATQKKLLFRLGPGKITVQIIGENRMSDSLLFVVYLPPKSAPDVVARELTVEINGSIQVLELDADSSEVPALSGPDGASVILSLVDIDNAGNRSEASVFSTELKDTIAPPKPGMLGLEVTAEDFGTEESAN